jgi:hypothetical protein
MQDIASQRAVPNQTRNMQTQTQKTVPQKTDPKIKGTESIPK